MKTSRKLLVVVLALVMILACTVPAMAANEETSYYGSYTQGAIANAPTDYDGMTVYLSIQSSSVDGSYISRWYYPVPMTTSDYNNGVCFVGDVLRKAATYYSNWLHFYSAQGALPNGPTDNVYGIADTAVNGGNTIFAPVLSIDYRNGWRFTVNGQYVKLNSADYPASSATFDPNYDYPVGATIETAYVTNGESIELFFGETDNSSIATRRLYVDAASYLPEDNYLIMQVYESHDYYTEGQRWYTGDNHPRWVSYWTWTITNYVRMTSISSDYYIEVSIDGGDPVEAEFISGFLAVDLSVLDEPLSTGIHTVEILPTFNEYLISGTEYGIPYTTGYILQFAIN